MNWDIKHLEDSFTRLELNVSESLKSTKDSDAMLQKLGSLRNEVNAWLADIEAEMEQNEEVSEAVFEMWQTY